MDHLTKDQSDLKSDQMSTWPKVISYLATRCLCWGYIWWKVSLTKNLAKCQPSPKPHLKETHLIKGHPDLKIWPNVNLIWSSITLSHKMLLPGWYIWPDVNLTWSLMKCQSDLKPHPGGYIWPKVSLTQSLTKCQPDPKSHPGRVILTKGHPDPKIWPNVNLTQVISYLATRCLCWGYIWWKVSLTKNLAKCQPAPKPHLKETHLIKGYPDPKIWPNVNLTQSNIILGHQMSLLWLHLMKGQPDQKSGQMSTFPKASPERNTSDQRSPWPEDLTKCKPDLK